MQMTLQRQKFIVVEEKYRMNGLSQAMEKDLTFSINGGEEIGIINYFKNTYNYQVCYYKFSYIE